MPCIKASLITTVAYAPCQSDVGGVKLEYYSYRFIRSSSLVGSCIGFFSISSIFICDDGLHYFIYNGSW